MPFKRKRLGEPDWKISFDDPSPFRCIADTLSSLLGRAFFTVKTDGDSHYLLANGRDMEHSCVVSCHLQLDNVQINRGAGDAAEEFSFHLDTKQLLNSIDSPSCLQGCLVLEGHSKSAEIKIMMYDPEQRAQTFESVLNTYDDNERHKSLKPIEYTFVMEIDTGALKDIFKRGRKSRAEHLGIELHIGNSPHTAGVEWSQTAFFVNGDDNTTHEISFLNETSQSEEGDTVIRAANPALDGSPSSDFCPKANCDYRGFFSLEKVEAFIKNVPPKMITAFLKNGHPIMFVHFLRPGVSQDENYIRFLAAPCIEDE